MPFNPLTQVPAVHNGWLSDPLWTPPADGAAIPSLRNNSGAGDPANATGAQRPTFRASTAAFGGRPTAEFFGGQIMSAPIADIAQPLKFLFVASLTGAGNQVMFGLANSGTGAGRTATQWLMNGVTPVAAGTADSNPHSFFGAFASPNSAMIVDTTTVISGANTNVAGMPDLLLGAGPGLSSPMSGHLEYWGVYANATSNTDLSNLASDLRYFNGLSNRRPLVFGMYGRIAKLRGSVW